jgi:hypothetical protein
MKIIITNDEEKIGIVKDFSDLNEDKTGLMGQLVMELENLKQEIILIYLEGGIDNIKDE